MITRVEEKKTWQLDFSVSVFLFHFLFKKSEVRMSLFIDVVCQGVYFITEMMSSRTRGLEESTRKVSLSDSVAGGYLASALTRTKSG